MHLPEDPVVAKQFEKELKALLEAEIEYRRACTAQVVKETQ